MAFLLSLSPGGEAEALGGEVAWFGTGQSRDRTLSLFAVKADAGQDGLL